MPSFFEKIQAKLELYRLEQRYTRNRHRRSAFISNAIYVDGEYVYQTPNTTGSSTNSSATSSPIEQDSRRSLEGPSPAAREFQPQQSAQKKRLNRLSMPGFGSSGKSSSPPDWRHNMVDVREVR
ncbi:hypothetical protein F4779DRAFT_623686 [Xylariaceae sp. FL0662B]|nr:hypothetical protein F4779DRAFT_623686 [Xylariaceae sp. FL0662B]